MTTGLEETWISTLTELLRAARSLHPRNPEYQSGGYIDGQADLIARAAGLVPSPGRAVSSPYYGLIRAAITREDTVPHVVRQIQRKREAASR